MGFQRGILAGIVTIVAAATIAYAGPKALSFYKTSCRGLPAKTQTATDHRIGKIAYVTMAESPTKIIVMDADGANKHPLLDATQSSENPAWSPDGKQIAFTRWDFANRNIYVVNADGSALHAITNAQDASDPSWSPDGLHIAFAQVKQQKTDIYVMDSDGRNVKRLTNDDAADQYPIWSPDGKQIAFSSARNGRYEIYVMNADGSNIHQLTNTPDSTPGSDIGSDTPAWSPDGKYITFMSRRNGNSDIFLMNSDGSNQCALVFSKDLETSPAWAPDGEHILFRSNWELYSVAIDGSDLHAITDGAYATPLDIPSWSAAK